MKTFKILLLFLLLSFGASAQTGIFGNLSVYDRLKLNGTQVTGISTDTALAGQSNVSLVTELAVYKFVTGQNPLKTIYKKAGTDSIFKVTAKGDTSWLTNSISPSKTYSWAAQAINGLTITGWGGNDGNHPTTWSVNQTGTDINLGEYQYNAYFHLGTTYGGFSTRPFVKPFLDAGNLGFNQPAFAIGFNPSDIGATLDIRSEPNHRGLPPLRFRYNTSDPAKDTAIGGSLYPRGQNLYWRGNDLIERRIAYYDELTGGSSVGNPDSLGGHPASYYENPMIPASEVVYGNGTGVTSDPLFTYTPGYLELRDGAGAGYAYTGINPGGIGVYSNESNVWAAIGRDATSASVTLYNNQNGSTKLISSGAGNHTIIFPYTPNATSRYLPLSFLTSSGTIYADLNGQVDLSGITGGGGGDLLAANNLSDLANAATARTNLGLDNAANYPILNQSTTGNAATVTNGVYTTGSYSNPAWVTALAWSKLTGTPTTLAGYGITDAAPLASPTFTGIVTAPNISVSGTLTAFGSNTVPAIKAQSGWGIGSFLMGADINATTLTANTRKLARMVMPIYGDATSTAILFAGDNATVANKMYVGGTGGAATAQGMDEVHFATNNGVDRTSSIDRGYFGTDGNLNLNYNLKMLGSTSGTLSLAAPAVAGTNTITFPAATGTAALTSNPTRLKYSTAPSSPDANPLNVLSKGETQAKIDSAHAADAKIFEKGRGMNITVAGNTLTFGFNSVTISQRDALTPAVNDVVFQTDDGWLEKYDATFGWMPLSPNNDWRSKYGIEWYDPLASRESILAGKNGGAGSNIVYRGNSLSRQGAARVQTGSTATGYAGFWSNPSSEGIYGGSGIIKLTWFTYFESLSNATEEYVSVQGIANTTDYTLPGMTTGTFFQYDRAGTNNGGTAQTVWQCISRKAGTSTVTNTGVTVAVNTRYKMTIIYNAALSSVTYQINDVTVATHTTNLPTSSDAMRILLETYKTVGTGFVSTWFWDALFKEKFTTAR